jgi:sec-independent protein translocase protein TatB
VFGLSIGETLLIVMVILIVFGPDRLPELAQKAGRIFGQVRGQMDSVRREFYNTVYTPADELKRHTRELGRDLRSESVLLGSTPRESGNEPGAEEVEFNPKRSEERSPLCPDYGNSAEPGPTVETKVENAGEVSEVELAESSLGVAKEE